MPEHGIDDHNYPLNSTSATAMEGLSPEQQWRTWGPQSDLIRQMESSPSEDEGRSSQNVTEHTSRASVQVGLMTEADDRELHRRYPPVWHRRGGISSQRPRRRSRMADNQIHTPPAFPDASNAQAISMQRNSQNTASTDIHTANTRAEDAEIHQNDPRVPAASVSAEPVTRAQSTGSTNAAVPRGTIVIVDTNYVRAHPHEIFHHRGARNWGVGLPPPDMRSIQTNVRMPMQVAEEVQERLGIEWLITGTRDLHAITTASRLTVMVRRTVADILASYAPAGTPAPARAT